MIFKKLDQKTMTIVLIILEILFMCLPIFVTSFRFINGNSNKSSIYYDFTNLYKKDLTISTISERIHIVNNSGWVDFKNDGNCTGLGTYSDPYIIEDLIIDVRSKPNCILIENSDVYFIIQNCTLNGFSSTASGIEIKYVANGKLINNTASNNNGGGIFLFHSHNNTISGNTANHNYQGIWLQTSNNNTVSGNTVINNNENGILLFQSFNNTISGNNANHNIKNGISVEISDNNRINNNTSNKNQIGIYLWYSDKNTITDNNFLDNTQGAIVLSGNCVDNVFSGNILPSNINPVDKTALIFIPTIIGCCIIVVIVIIGVIFLRKRSAISKEVKKEEKERLEKEKAETLLQLTQESRKEGILTCFYHPKREANTKCEKCGKLICLECKMVYHVSHSGGTGDHSYTYSTRHETCPICFYDQKIKGYRSLNKTSPIFFTVIAITMLFIFGFYGIFVILLVIPLNAYIILYGLRKIKEINYQMAEFLNRIRDTQILKEKKILELYCPGCGEKLEPNTSICSYCGSVIKDF